MNRDYGVLFPASVVGSMPRSDFVKDLISEDSSVSPDLYEKVMGAAVGYVVALQEPTPAETAEILRALAGQIASFHRLQIEDRLMAMAVRASETLTGLRPAKAITVLDEAASSAALLGADVLTPDDIYSAASRCTQGACLGQPTI